MAGLSDYSAQNILNWMFGVAPLPGTAAALTRFLALFSTAPTSDAGTGGTEVAGGGYARVQVAGQLTAGASWTTSSNTITLSAAAPSWLTALGANGSNVNLLDATTGQQIGAVSSISGSTVTLQANALHASSGSADLLQFSAFGQAAASSGSEPSTAPANIAQVATINFAQATGTWASGGTIPAFGIFDALSGGNIYTWDYLGNYKWIPFTCTSASPGVLSTDSSSDVPANGSSIVVSAKYGGTLPSTSGSWSGLLTSANASANTFTAGVNTTSVGAGEFRQVSQFGPIGNLVTVSFPVGNITGTLA